MGDDRPMRYVEDDKVVYRASMLAACERAFVACANGTPGLAKPDWFQQVLDEGTEAEPIIQAHWDAQTGVPTIDQQREFELEIGTVNKRLVVVRCHIDGATEGGRLREFKKFRDSTWPEFQRRGVEVRPFYPWQVSVCMLAGDFDECEFVGGHWSNGEIVEVQSHLLTHPPVNLLAIKKRVKRIERLINAGFDAREVECNKNLYPCPWFKLHDDEGDSETFELPDTDEARLFLRNYADSCAEVNRHRKALEEAEKWKKNNAEALREYLAMLGDEAVAAKKLIGAEFEVQHVRKTIPAHMRSESTQDYFTIKKRKG